MVDHLTKEKRSWNMSRIRSGNTLPEKTVRSVLHRMGFRFRLHRKDLPGKPDIFIKKRNAVIFVHGCFWHQHPGCKYATIPKSNIAFWDDKLQGNMRRDKERIRVLKEQGYNVKTIWECETKDSEKLAKKLNEFLNDYAGE
jgi:DNA mismatch endonuclease (patch repair protein)